MANDVYGKIVMSTGDLKDMIRSFENLFGHFIKMKTFKSEYAIYLIDRKNLSGLKRFFSDETKNIPEYNCYNIFP